MNAAAAKSPWLIAVAATLATFMEVLDTTIVNVSLSHIAGTLGAASEESTWVLTAYLVANAIVLPLSGWLSDVFGRKRFFMCCIFGFTIASFLCGASLSLPMLIFFRLMQGLSGGGLQPTQQAIILDSFPPEKRGMAFGIVGITMIVAPVLGPTLGGLITDNFSWRWIFFINIPFGILALFAIGKLLPTDVVPEEKKHRKIDYIGLSLIALCIGALQIMLDKGQTEDWFHSDLIIICAVISAAAAVFAIFWMLRQKAPVIELRLLKDKSYAIACIIIFATGFTLYGGAAILPLLLQSEFGYSSTLAGYVLSPGAFLLIFLMPLMGKLMGYVQARYLIFIGMLLTSVGMWHSMFLTPQLNYETFVWIRVTQVLGLPFLFIPASTMAFLRVPPHLNNKASAFYALCRNIGGSVGIALAVTYVLRRQQVHQNFLSEKLSLYNPDFRVFLESTANAIGSTDIAMQRIYRELLHQASILSYADVYEALAVIVLVVASLTFFMPSNNPKAGRGKPPALDH